VVDFSQIKARLADMQLREAINQNQNIVVIVAVVIIAVSGLFIAMRCDGGGGRTNYTNKAYYYDTVTEELFVDEGDQLAPITSPDGNPAVRAHIFACGSCDDDDARFVAFYAKYTDEAKQKIEQAQQGERGDAYMYGMMEFEEGGLLHSFDGQNWWPADDDERSGELHSRLNCDNGKDARYCRP